MNQIIGIIGIIEDNHNLTVSDIRLLDSHFGTEIYKIDTDKGEYIVKAMPYLLYFWHCICNYVPGELPNIPESYKPTAILIQKLLAWLYDNVDRLSNDLSSRKLNRHN